MDAPASKPSEAGHDDPPLYPPTVKPPAGPLSLTAFFARFVRNPISSLPRQVYEQPFYRMQSERPLAVWVTGPDLIERILLSDADHFPKTPLERQVFGPALGRGILTSEGEAWRWQRKIAAPAFRYSELLAYVPAMARAGEAQLAKWRGHGPARPAQIDVDMTETTFEVISNTILAGCDAREGAMIKQAGREFLDPISWSIAYAMLRLPPWAWHPGKRRMLAAAETVREGVRQVLRRRRREGGGGEDLLGRLLAARHPETGEPLPDEVLVDNLATFLAAGHETTAKALTWTLYLLARAPGLQERVRAEVVEVAGRHSIDATDIVRLELTQRVLKEAMRLYPPAPVLTRVARDAVVLGGKEVAAGTLVVIPIYALHRHRRLWVDPDRFDPDRFLPESEDQMPRTQYMPFGFGGRTCIGSSFAMIEATAILATLVRGARLTWDGKHLPEPVSRVTLRPRSGMPLNVTVL